MVNRKNFYVAAAIGASLSYIFNVLAFTGSFDVIRWAVFIVIFLITTLGFEKFIEWQVEE